MNNDNCVHLNKEGSFYSVYNNDAFVISYIMNYKLVNIDNINVKTGFPTYLLDKVLTKLKKYHISYLVSDTNEFNDYGKYNNYQKCFEIDPTHTGVCFQLFLRCIQNKNYKGTFEILFEDENEKQTFEIDKNINQNAEIVTKVINNDIGSTITLKSGIKFKIISKNIY